MQQVLTDAYADGRLDRDEYDERSDRANAARTLGDLPAIVSDLVATTAVETARPAGLAHAGRRRDPPARGRGLRIDRREAVFGFLFATLVCTVIWFARHRRDVFSGRASSRSAPGSTSPRRSPASATSSPATSASCARSRPRSSASPGSRTTQRQHVRLATARVGPPGRRVGDGQLLLAVVVEDQLDDVTLDGAAEIDGGRGVRVPIEGRLRTRRAPRARQRSRPHRTGRPECRPGCSRSS